MLRSTQTVLAVAVAGLLAAGVAHAAAAPAHVLVLNSYHRGFDWTDGETDGALQALRQRLPEVELYVYDLDRKRLSGPSADADAVAALRTRFAGIPVDGIVATDDAALAFALRHGQALFGKAPIAYCGVNGAPPPRTPGRRVSGVLERVDLEGTLALVQAMQPGLRRVLVALDTTETSAGIAPEVARAAAAHPSLDVRTVELVSFAELEALASGLDPREDALVLGSFTRDREGAVASYEQVAERVTRRSRAPVYGLWDFQLGHGVVGGALLAGEDQGRRAGEILVRLLAGEDPTVDAGAASALTVDAPVAARHELEAPPHVGGRPVRILRQPEGLWRRSWPWIVAALAILIGLSAFSAALLFIIRALRRSERRFRELADLLPQVVYEADRDGHIVFVNRQALATFGFDRIPAGLRVEHLVAAPDRPAAEERVARLLGGSPVGEGGREYEVKRADGSSFPVVIYSSPVLRDGKPAGFRGIIVDVSEQRRAEAEREALRHRVEEGQRLEALGRLAGGIAHDFNNLLTPILGNASDALEELGPAHPLAARLEEVVDAARRAAGLVRQLLAFGRRQPLLQQTLDLNAEITGFEAILRRLIGEDVAVRLELSEDLWPMRGDPGQLQQVLLNLAANGRDAMPGGGVLTVRTRNRPGPGPGAIELTVSDTGAGMDADVLRRAFEPYFTTKEPGRGTGLGLATVLAVVKQHGGDVSVSSVPGQGTTFRVVFPAVVGAPVPRPSGAPALLPVARPDAPKTVLLAEDEAGIRRLIERYLTAAGYRVLSAEDGLHALTLARAHGEPIDLLLSDVVMPGLNGRELSRELRARQPGLRVLFMSGYTAIPGTQEDILAGTADPFLEKPFDREQLVAKVGQVLRG